MNLLGKSLLFLLIGNAFSQNFNQNQDFGFVNQEYSGGPQAMLQTAMLVLTRKCQDAGHSEVMSELPQTLQELQRCIEQKVNVKELTEEFSSSLRTSSLQTFAQNFCSIWPNIHTCINPVTTLVKKCLDSDEARAVDKSIDIIDATNTFFCENKAQRIITFINEGGQQCIESEKDKLTGCINETMKTRQPKKEDKLFFNYDENDCGDFHKTRKCFVSKLSECPSKEPSKIFDDYLSMIGVKVCSSATSITWYSFVNVILLLVTYLYSKTF